MKPSHIDKCAPIINTNEVQKGTKIMGEFMDEKVDEFTNNSISS